MRKKRKASQELINKVIATAGTRSALENFVFRFLLNFSKSCELFDLIKKNGDERLITQGLCQYIVSLVSILETFFRDIFVFIINRDASYCSTIISTFNLRLDNTAIIPDTMGITNFLPEFFNFQNISDLLKVFNPLFKNNFIEEIGTVVVPVIHNEEILKFSLNHSIPDWFQLITTLLDERHNITHDANYTTNLKLQNFARIEKTILYFGQIFIIWIATYYRNPLIMLSMLMLA